MSGSRQEDSVPMGNTCPIPLSEYPRVVLAHGGGGRLMGDLIERLFVPTFANAYLDQLHDGAAVDVDGVRLAFSTDSYVVDPLFFPGGDIGSLAVNGTVNDLAMCGAEPLYLSTGFIIEEGLDMETLWRVARSMQAAAQAAGVNLVTGDTKVVERGKGDQLFINTAGIGRVPPGVQVGPAHIEAGDAIIVSGDIGRHGMAIMAQREGLAFETPIESDCAPVVGLVRALADAGVRVHCLRDLTRGGLATALVEIATSGRVAVALVERDIPVSDPVRGACEVLGLDPLYVANEGRFIAVVAAADADRALATLQSREDGAGAACIGRVDPGRPGVTLKSTVGGTRIVDRLSGEQLPRIC